MLVIVHEVHMPRQALNATENSPVLGTQPFSGSQPCYRGHVGTAQAVDCADLLTSQVSTARFEI
jgi:hypothetical protein